MTNFQSINLGGAPNDHTGDPLRTGGQKINDNFGQIDTGPITIGPPVSSAINLTIDQGAYENNQTPGIWVKGNVGFQAAISIGANGTSPGVASFDFQQAATGDCYIVCRANAGLAVWTNNTPRLTFANTGRIINTAPTSDVTALFINGQAVGGVSGALKCLSTDSVRIATFDCTQATGGYIAVERSGADKVFLGDSSVLAGGSLDDYVLRSNNGLDFAAGGGNRRLNIASTGAVTVLTPSNGIPLTIVEAATDSQTNPGIRLTSSAGNSARISICGNASTPGTNSFDIIQVSTNDCYIVQRANNNMAFWTNNTPAMLLSNFQQAFFYGNVGVNGVTPPVQVTGFGAPVGAAVINNYNITDAGGANSNTNKCVAEILTVLKNFGLIGA